MRRRAPSDALTARAAHAIFEMSFFGGHAMISSRTLACCTFFLFAGPAAAEIVTESRTYPSKGETMEGFIAYNDALEEPRPLVVIVHDWDGLTQYEQDRADQLARLGFVAVAVDLYGQGVRPTTTETKSAEAAKYRDDRNLMRRRLRDGLKFAKDQFDDAPTVSAIGYCFGGGAVLEMARAGAGVDHVVSFHGDVATPEGQDYAKAEAAMLVLHGGADPFVSMEDVSGFVRDTAAAGANAQVVIYPQAVHSFTDFYAADQGLEGVAYDGAADRGSWSAMMRLIQGVQ